MPPLMCSCNMLQSLSDFGRHKTDGKRRETDGKKTGNGRKTTDSNNTWFLRVLWSWEPRLCKAMIHALCSLSRFLVCLVACGIFENSSHGRSSLAESPRLLASLKSCRLKYAKLRASVKSFGKACVEFLWACEIRASSVAYRDY